MCGPVGILHLENIPSYAQQNHIIVLTGSISSSFASDRKAEKRGRRAGKTFGLRLHGLSKASMVWLNYKCTCLVTSLSGACQRLHPKNKTWHIKKNTICFEWWLGLLSVSSPVCVRRWRPQGDNLNTFPSSSAHSSDPPPYTVPWPSGHYYPKPGPCVRLDPVAMCPLVPHQRND